MNTPYPPAHDSPGGDNWRQAAACRRAPRPAVFFPRRGVEGRQDAAAAKAICAGCPVQAACLDDVLAENIEFGIFGGTTPKERRTIRAARRAATVQASA